MAEETKKLHETHEHAHGQKSGPIAVVRVRGSVHVRGTIEDTLKMLHLKRANWMIVVPNVPTYMGMVKKVKDFITWGEIDEGVLEKILEKWGRKAGEERLNKTEAKEFARKMMAGQRPSEKDNLKPYFKLHPPSHGYERGGVKIHVKLGGAQGYRGKDINILLARMAGLKEEKAKEKKDGAKE